MKRFASSVAAGVLAVALAAPGWAQAPMTPSSRPSGTANPAQIPPTNPSAPSSGAASSPTAAAPAQSNAASGTATQGNAAPPANADAAPASPPAAGATPTGQPPKRVAHRRFYRNSEADSLNAAELARLRGGAPMPPAPASYPPPYPPPFPFWFPPFWPPRPY